MESSFYQKKKVKFYQKKINGKFVQIHFWIDFGLPPDFELLTF